MAKIRDYTPLGKRIAALCGSQSRIAIAVGLDRSQISRKLHGETPLTVDELTDISNYFRIPIRLFFAEPDMDDEVFAECYRLFKRDAFALDRIIEAVNLDPKNLRKLGELANDMRLAHKKEKRKYDNSRG